MASSLDHDPTLPRYWSEHLRDKVKVKVKVTSLYMPQRASQRKLGKKPVTKPI
jgi:hypothetical protein